MRDSLNRCVIAILVVLAATAGTDATTLLRVEELPTLVEQSRRAALVEVVDLVYAYDEHELPSTFLTLRVEDAIYGTDLPPSGETMKIKLFGSPEAMPDGRRTHLDGTPRYLRGERYLLLLLGRSDWGFTNTAGLMFGAFRVTPDAQGGMLARSLGGNRYAIGNGGLGPWLGDDPAPDERAAPAEPEAPVPYPLLRQALTNLWIDGGGIPLPVRARETRP